MSNTYSKLAIVLVPSTEDSSSCVSSVCSQWLVLGGAVLGKLVVTDAIEVPTFPHVCR